MKSEQSTLMKCVSGTHHLLAYAVFTLDKFNTEHLGSISTTRTQQLPWLCLPQPPCALTLE
jgi:hypothetical protein